MREVGFQPCLVVGQRGCVHACNLVRLLVGQKGSVHDSLLHTPLCTCKWHPLFCGCMVFWQRLRHTFYMQNHNRQCNSCCTTLAWCYIQMYCTAPSWSEGPAFALGFVCTFAGRVGLT